MQNLHLILGSPGCGKTTRVLDEVDTALQNGVAPEKIGFVSFTRKAANEAADRAAVKFSMDRQDMPYFRTLHSVAFRLLGLRREEILRDYSPIADALGMSFKVDPENPAFMPVGAGSHMEIPFLEALARNQCITLREQWHRWQEANPDMYLDWHLLDLYRRTLDEYKRDLGLLDYTDLLQRVVAQNLELPVELLIVDEAQDLSELQWHMVHRIARSARRVIVAGDDDQCIYQWAGAAIDTFLSLAGTREVLHHSHRLPMAIFNKAQDIVQRIRHRYAKTWTPRSDPGEYRECGSLSDIHIRPDETYMFLARNHYHLADVRQYLREAGYLYTTNGNEYSVDADYLSVVRNWERLRKGKALPLDAVLPIYDAIKTGHGIARGAKKKLHSCLENRGFTLKDLTQDYGLQTTSIWHDALNMVPVEDREYILNCLRNGERLDRAPRIYVGTIHSVKGGEADNVVLIPDLSRLSWKSYTTCEDAETRVLYVAVTRARQRLMTLFPTTPRYYYV